MRTAKPVDSPNETIEEQIVLYAKYQALKVLA